MATEPSRVLPHIYLPGNGAEEPYASPRSGGGSSVPPARNRAEHAAALKRALATALAAADAIRAQPDPLVTSGTPGVYLEFELPAAHSQIVDRLEKRGRGERIELVAVHPADDAREKITATVFVPDGQRDYYLRKIEAYRTEQTRTGKPKNQPLVASIETVRLAVLRSLYTDSPDLFPAAGQTIWWEVWLRREMRPIFEQAARGLNIVLRPHSIMFPEREVILAITSIEVLGRVVAHSDTIAELRLARDSPATFMEMTPDDQVTWSEELAERVILPSPDAPAVCLLDSGTTSRHPLIRPSLPQVASKPGMAPRRSRTQVRVGAAMVRRCPGWRSMVIWFGPLLMARWFRSRTGWNR